MIASGSTTVTIGSRCGSPRAAHPAQPTPAFYTGWMDKGAAGGLLLSEVARPWLSHWSPEERRWMHVTGQTEQEAELVLAPTRPQANRPAAAGPAATAKAPPAAAATPLTITLEMAAGSRIDTRQLPRGASLGLEATDQGSLLLHLTLPPGAKLSFGPGAATASHAAGAASPPHCQPPHPPTPAFIGGGAPASSPDTAFHFASPAPAVPTAAAATPSTGHSAGSGASPPTPGTGPAFVAAATAAAAQPAVGQVPAEKAGSEAGAASQAALSIALLDTHWDRPELSPDWHLTVRQGDRTLRSVRLDASAATTLRISKARRTVVLKATDEHTRLVVRLQRHEWRSAMRLLSRAMTEAVCGCRLWSQQGSGLLRSSLLPGAAAALAAAALAAAQQAAQEAGSEGGEGSSVEPASEPAPMSPAKRLPGLRITAPAECLTTQPPAAERHGDGSAGPLARQSCDAPGSAV